MARLRPNSAAPTTSRRRGSLHRNIGSTNRLRRLCDWRAVKNHVMVELRRHRRRLLVVGITTAALLGIVLSAKALDAEDPCQAPSAAPPAETALMPAGLSFDQIGTVTRVRKVERHVMAHAVTTKPLDEVTVLIQDAVTAAGYRPAGMDNEGFEAEVFFTTGSYAAGQAVVRQSGCEGRWNIDLVLLDRDAAPSRTTLPATIS
jgi:hypothetical protein